MSLLTERIRKDVEKKNRAARSVESVAFIRLQLSRRWQIR